MRVVCVCEYAEVYACRRKRGVILRANPSSLCLRVTFPSQAREDFVV